MKLGGRLDFKQLLMVVYAIHYIFTSVLYIPGGAGFLPSTESLQVLMSPDVFFVFVGSLLKKKQRKAKKMDGSKKLGGLVGDSNKNMEDVLVNIRYGYMGMHIYIYNMQK